MNKISVLKNSIMDYAWGSRSFIAELTGEPSPSAYPQAEMWMGTHEKAPSKVVYNDLVIPLDRLIRDDPYGTLGPAVARRFENKLPFLFKVLSAERPLSIQAHPDKYQAIEGFERENLKGIPVDSPARNYRDSSHKPELICALEPLWAMKGFRRISKILDLAAQAGVRPEEFGTDMLQDQPDEEGLKRFFMFIMSMDRGRRKKLVRGIVKRLDKIKDDDPAFEWIRRLSIEYPDDIGALSPLFLNVIQLQPGEALFINACELHAYLKGSGLEIMTNSDNVLRGGLTTKHVDVPELINILSFRSSDVSKILPLKKDEFESVYDSPVKEFALSKIDLPERSCVYESYNTRSAEIIINTKGNAEISDHSGNKLPFLKGTSMFIPASVKNYSIKGEAVIYKASVPI